MSLSRERVAVVMGTYNRLGMLQGAIETVRERAGIDCHFIVIDGGSVDGSQRWLAEQRDVTLIEQRGELTGAVRAFNLGFSLAVDRGYDFVLHFNDDAELVTFGAVAAAVDTMDHDAEIGAVAFEMDFRGDWGFENIHGLTYSNFGLIRREAGMDVARAQGDPLGCCWWNPIYRTYAADSEFGCWLHRLGWTVYEGVGWRVHDLRCDDALRKLNRGDDPSRPDSKLFWSRWPNRKSIQR